MDFYIEVSGPELDSILWDDMFEIVRPVSEEYVKLFSEFFRMYPGSSVPLGFDTHEVVFFHGDAQARRLCRLMLKDSRYILRKGSVIQV